MLDYLYKVKLRSQPILLLQCYHYHQIGPPLIILSHVSSNSFSLLVPDVNTADVTVLSQNVVLSTNLVGRWQRPNYDNVTHNSISFSIFYQSGGGLYKFYVPGWDGEEILSIQIYLSIMGKNFVVELVYGFTSHKTGPYQAILNWSGLVRPYSDYTLNYFHFYRMS